MSQLRDPGDMTVTPAGAIAAALRRLRRQDPHAPRLDLVDRAHHLQASLGLACLALRRFHDLADRPAHVALHGARHLLLGREARVDVGQAGHDVRQQELDARPELLALVPRGQRRADRSAALVAEDHEQRRLQVRAGVLQRAGDLLAQHVAGDADDEELAQARVEDPFGRHARVAAAEDGRPGLLAPGEVGEGLAAEGGGARLTPEEALVSVDEALQGLLGGEARGSSHSAVHSRACEGRWAPPQAPPHGPPCHVISVAEPARRRSARNTGCARAFTDLRSWRPGSTMMVPKSSASAGASAVPSMLPVLAPLALLLRLAVPLAAQLGPPTMVDVAYRPYMDAGLPHSDDLPDLDAHSDAGGLQPVLIELHPGGFTSGSKSDFTTYLDDAKGVDAIDKAYAAGFAVVSADYPLAQTAVFPDGSPNPKFPKNKFPHAVHSVRRVIQFVRAQAGEWKLDPDRVFVIGSSAGGNLGLWAAMTKDVAKPLSDNPVTQQSSRPNGVVFLSTPTFLDAAHVVLPPDEAGLLSYFGKPTQAALEKPAAMKKSLAASPAWRATHKKGGPKFSDAMVQLNASMPLLGVYEDLDVSATSSSYTFPVDDVHSAAMGLLMREALDDYAAQQDPSAHWVDFTLLNVEVDHPDGPEVTADAVVAWLKAHAGLP